MHADNLAAFSIDLTRLHRRTVTSFYSNLVTRPTGRAVRMGVEQQLVELGRGAPCVSVLDFSQVNVLDYSCADEIVAKLLLRYSASDRPVDAYFVARGLQPHHVEAVESVLHRQNLLLVVEDGEGKMHLLGPCDPMERDCWGLLMQHGRVSVTDLAALSGFPQARGEGLLRRLVSRRIAVPLADGVIGPISALHDN